MSLGEALPFFEGEDNGQLNTRQPVVALVPTMPPFVMPEERCHTFERIWLILEALGLCVVADTLLDGAPEDSDLVFLYGPHRHMEQAYELLERIDPGIPVRWCPSLYPEQFVVAAVFHSLLGPFAYFSLN